MSDVWTVVLTAAAPDVTPEQCRALREWFPSLMEVSAAVHGGLLTVALTVEGASPSAVVTQATAVFLGARRSTWPDGGVDIVAVDCRRDQVSVAPALISHNGLAARAGITRQGATYLMGRKGAPDPLVVEGGAREAVYDAGVALPYVLSRRRSQ